MRWRLRPRSRYCSSFVTMSSGEISVRIGMFPEMKTTEPYSPTARANASANPVSHAGRRLGRTTRRSTAARPAPRLAAASSTSASRSSMTGCRVRTTNGRPMKISATVMPSGVKATLMPNRASGSPEPAVRRVQRRQHDAGDRGRQRERQIDQRVHDAPAGERIAHEHPRHQEAEHARSPWPPPARR